MLQTGVRDMYKVKMLLSKSLYCKILKSFNLSACWRRSLHGVINGVPEQPPLV